MVELIYIKRTTTTDTWEVSSWTSVALNSAAFATPERRWILFYFFGGVRRKSYAYCMTSKLYRLVIKNGDCLVSPGSFVKFVMLSTRSTGWGVQMTHLKKISKKEFFIPKFLCEANIGISLHMEARNTKVRGGARSPGETDRAFIVPGLVFLLIPKWKLYKFLLLQKGDNSHNFRHLQKKESIITQTGCVSQLGAWYHHLGSCFRLTPLTVSYIGAWLVTGRMELITSWFVDTGNGGIWLIIPGIWLMLLRMAVILLLVLEKSSMLSCSLKAERLAEIWFKTWIFSSSRCWVAPSITGTS